MSLKDADRMANSADPDQTASQGAVWSGSALGAVWSGSALFAILSGNLGSLWYILILIFWRVQKDFKMNGKVVANQIMAKTVKITIFESYFGLRECFYCGNSM